ncbi:MAG: hypothetical protein GWN84_16695 [Gammaproteobacteria bacterium]|nr:hypothetical protein [Gammaproteobacteria bacterium]NIR84477.1 hypothetical protein [Gammaproteobacteria bacterium]NIR90380.1 hypothetical protein [Gammaproteobacteria bacterium]NIU05528.1 hypothetical protein [Gammaproteobacteria bacterium]NIV52667.1 hypothetical protein [Gammaproteobacteria bacterium]
MLTLKDCLDFCDLSDEVVRAIAVHEGVPNIVAVEIGTNLLRTPRGYDVIERYIQDDIAASERHGRPAAAEHWRSVLSAFRSVRPR